MEIKPRALRVNDFCSAYGVSRSKAYALIREGKVRSIKLGGRRVIAADDAEALIAASVKKPGAVSV